MRKNFFTSFYNALSDPATYYSFQKEMNLKAVEQVFFNSFSGKSSFRAVVLPADVIPDALSSRSSKIKAIRVRPLDIHGFILPEPCEEKNVERRKKIIAMHPVAYPDETFPVAGGNIEDAVPITTGMVVECAFADGPQSGRLRGLTYRKSNVYTTGINLECFGTVREDLKKAFEGIGPVPIPPTSINGRLSFGGRHMLEKIEAKITPSNQIVVGVGAPEVLGNANAEISFWSDKSEIQAGKKGQTDKNHPVYRRVQLYTYYTKQMSNKDKGKPYRETSEYFSNYLNDEAVKKTYILAGQDGTTGFLHWSAVLFLGL